MPVVYCFSAMPFKTKFIVCTLSGKYSKIGPKQHQFQLYHVLRVKPQIQEHGVKIIILSIFNTKFYLSVISSMNLSIYHMYII